MSAKWDAQRRVMTVDGWHAKVAVVLPLLVMFGLGLLIGWLSA